MTAYICGDQAAEYTALPDPVRAGVYELAQIFPDALDTFERGWMHNWLADPYAQGAFSHLAPGYAGIRPKIAAPEEPAPDFVVQGPRAHGVAGLVHLFGIESPGLTASLSLAETVLRELG